MASDITIYPATFVGRSGTIVTGGVAQNAVAFNPGRKYLLILNPRSASESLWFNLAGIAVAGGEGTSSIELVPGSEYEAVGPAMPTSAVSVVAATTSHRFTILEGL